MRKKKPRKKKMEEVKKVELTGSGVTEPVATPGIDPVAPIEQVAPETPIVPVEVSVEPQEEKIV